jgi:hypothetical protein
VSPEFESPPLVVVDNSQEPQWFLGIFDGRKNLCAKFASDLKCLKIKFLITITEGMLLPSHAKNGLADKT